MLLNISSSSHGKSNVGCSHLVVNVGLSRQGRGCLDQVFAVRQVCEKYLANGKDVFWEIVGCVSGWEMMCE